MRLVGSQTAITFVAVLVVALLALVPILGQWSATQAQAARVLVDNAAQTQNGVMGLGVFDVAQEFTTGANDDGYTVTSIGLVLVATATGSSFPTVKLFSGSANGTEEDTLIPPSGEPTATAASYVFTTSGTVLLASSTSYWVVVEGSHPVSWSHTDLNDEDTTSLTDWKIDNRNLRRERKRTDAFNTFHHQVAQLLTVNGKVEPNVAPTSADARVSVLRNEGFILLRKGERAAFTFMDGNPSDVLTRVIITSLPGPNQGELRFNGVALTVSDLPKKVHGTELDVGRLTYHPPPNVAGGGLATFNFKVNDGDADSVEHTMTIDVLAPVLVSNLDEADASATLNTANHDVAQKFTTGPNGLGYDLASIEVELDAAAGTNGAMTALIWEGAADTAVRVATLTAPTDLPAGVVSLTAPPNTRLRNDTDYYLVIEGSGGADAPVLTMTNSDGQDGDGWEIADARETRAATNTAGFTEESDGDSLKILVRGVAVEPETLVSNADQTDGNPFGLSTRDLAQSFTTGDNPDGYVFTKIGVWLNTATDTPGFMRGDSRVPIVTLHEGSANGTKLTDFTGQEIMPQDESKTIEFSPVSVVPLESSTTYWVVIESDDTETLHAEVMPTDSRDEDQGKSQGWSIADRYHKRSADSTGNFTGSMEGTALKITVEGFLPVNFRPTGEATVAAPNVFRVPAELRVDLSTVDDFNGVINLATVTSVKWQRLAQDGRTVEDDSISTEGTYKLTSQDVGKTIRAVAQYTDDHGFEEGPLTTPATAVIRAGAECAAPTYVGGATQLWAGRVGVHKLVGQTSTLYGYMNLVPSGFGGKLGSLSDDTFTAVNDHTIDLMFTEIEGVNPPEFEITLRGSTALTDPEKNQLALHICDDEQINFIDSTHGLDTTFGQVYNWTPGPDWADYAQRTLYISRDQVKPTMVSAQGLGTSLDITFSEPLDDSVTLSSSAFTGKRTPSGGGGEVDLDFTGTPSISGRTVTLTLTNTSAILSDDTNVKVNYTMPSTNNIQDLFGNEADGFMNEEVIIDETPPELDVNTPPTVSTNGNTLTITYNEALDTNSVPDGGAFEVKATPSGGTETTLALDIDTPVTVSGSTVQLIIEPAIAHNDIDVKVKYTKPLTGDVIQDLAGNDADSFDFQQVTNNSTAPRVSIVAVHDDATPGIANPVFRVTRSNTAASALQVKVDFTQTDQYLDATGTITIPANHTSAEGKFKSEYTGNTSGTLTATVAKGAAYAPALAPNDEASVQMKIPATGNPLKVAPLANAYTVTESATIETTTVNPVFRFTTGAGVARPRESITVNAATDEDGTATINVDYTHVAGSFTVDPAGYVQSGTAFRQDISRAIEIATDTVYEGPETFSYVLSRFSGETGTLDVDACVDSDPSDGKCRVLITIRDSQSLGVSGVEITSTAPTDGYHRAGSVIQFTVTFNGAVAVTGTPQLDFDVGGQTRRANYASGSGSQDLVFSYTVANGDNDHDGISWRANSLSLNGGTIKFMHTEPSERIDASLTHPWQGTLPQHKVDTTKPTLQEARLRDDTVVLTFNEALNTTAPAASRFTVKVDGGTGSNPSSVSIAGRVVTLSLSSRPTPQDSMTVSYNKPGTNPIKDLSGLEADGFTDTEVTIGPQISFGARSYTVTEGSTVQVTVELTQAPDREMVIGMGSTNQGRTSYSDYSGVPARITFTTSDTTKTFTFSATQDRVGDPGESVRLFFRTLPSGVGRGTPFETTVHITDDDEPPAAPSNLSATAGDRRVTLSWNNPGDSLITRYQYRYQLTSANEWNPDWTTISGSHRNTTSYTVRSLTNRVAYTFEVRAMRGLVAGASSAASATPEGSPTAPAAPERLSVSSGDGSLQVSWNAPSRGDSRAPVTSYRVQYRQVRGSWRTVSRASDDNSLNQAITGLTNQRHYEVRVAAVNRVGTGPWATAKGTPQSPSIPSDDGNADSNLRVTGLYAYWTDSRGSHTPHPDANGNALTLDSCTGNHSFRVIWSLPNDRKPDRWDADVATRRGAGTVSQTLSSGSADYPYMTGTINLGSAASFSVRVRGRFGATWGTWSTPVLLTCREDG